MGLEESFIEPISAWRSCRIIGEKLSRIEGREGEVKIGVEEGEMQALRFVILSSKKEKKVLQLLFEKADKSEGEGVTIFVMVWNRTLGQRLLMEYDGLFCSFPQTLYFKTFAAEAANGVI